MLNDLTYIIPEIILMLTAFSVILVSAAEIKIVRGNLIMATFMGSALSLIYLFFFISPFQGFSAFYNILRFDGITYFFRAYFLVLMMIIIIISIRSKELDNYLFGEYLILLTGATVGMSFMASSNDLLMLYMSMELVSLVSYLMTGYIPKSKKGSEAAVKYILFGGVSSAIMLFGMSYMFGIFGTLKFDEIMVQMAAMTSRSILLSFSILLVFTGFAFKAALVPFHFWTPDVYEAAPTPVAAFLSVGPKAAAFAVMIRFFYQIIASSPTMKDDLVILLSVISALTMTAGNLLAIKQENVKRLLAYSSIAHSGYILMGIIAFSSFGLESLLFYIFAYMLMNTGAFAIASIAENQWGSSSITDFNGLAWKGGFSVFISVMFAVFLFSLAGIPPFAGFIGKWYLFAAVIDKQIYWLVIVAFINSVIGLFYYARIVKAMFLNSGGGVKVLAPERMIQIVISLLALSTIYFGLFFSGFFNYIKQAVK